MSDVSALVLTIGESFTERALASLAKQTLPPAAVIVVENISPFSSAMNAGIPRVKTPFFVQVDADMILDPGCIEALRAATDDRTGVTVGELRDPLMGRVVGVKLFRTECFERAAFCDSITPDTDYIAEIGRMGWRTVYIRNSGDGTNSPPAFGDHLPEYSPGYTYRKFTMEGARLRYRGSRTGLKWRLGLLEKRSHPLAALSRIALAHGFFYPSDRDLLRPFADDPDVPRLLSLLKSQRESDTTVGELLSVARHARLRDAFRLLVRAGQQIARQEAGKTAGDMLTALDGSGEELRSAVAVIAFGRGLTSPDRDDAGLAADEDLVRRFVTLGVAANAGVRDTLRAHAARAADRIGLRSPAARW